MFLGSKVDVAVPVLPDGLALTEDRRGTGLFRT